VCLSYSHDPVLQELTDGWDTAHTSDDMSDELSVSVAKQGRFSLVIIIIVNGGGEAIAIRSNHHHLLPLLLLGGVSRELRRVVKVLPETSALLLLSQDVAAWTVVEVSAGSTAMCVTMALTGQAR
jgi:hypothetical protein